MKKSPGSLSESPAPSTVSERKLAANRANAQRSTGPRTAAGKARSSLNALRHGILARAAFNLTIEGAERRKEFDALIAGLAEEFQPQTIVEHLMVQQLAGCWWRLAKVWRYEQEAAWRMWASPGIPMDEYNEYHDNREWIGSPLRDEIVEDAAKFLPDAGLDDPTIPNGASARTILRYQSAISSMLFRCLSLLERRKQARESAEDAPPAHDYLGELKNVEASEAAAAPAGEGAAQEAEASPGSEKPERTQKPGTDAEVSAEPAPPEAIETGPAGRSKPSTART